MREQAGLGGNQLARALGLNPTQVTQMEVAKIGVSADRLRTVAAACACGNQALVEALAGMATEREKGWWEEYRGLIPSDLLEAAEIEGHASKITTYTMAFIPGLLQTSSYATAVFAKGLPLLPRQEVDLRTAFRLKRQQAVRSGGTPNTAFIHEAALHIRYGSPAVLSQQLESLLEDSEHPRTSVRVVPFETVDFPGPSENLTYAEGPVPELDTVQADASFSTQLFNSPAQLANYRAILGRIASVALPDDESRDLIRSIMKK
jgi:DNA-binding transcriptional regulator YdaS (Cro superfamily)